MGSQESHDWCRAVYSDLLDQQNWETLILKYYPETFEYEKSQGNDEQAAETGVAVVGSQAIGQLFPVPVD